MGGGGGGGGAREGGEGGGGEFAEVGFCCSVGNVCS